MEELSNIASIINVVESGLKDIPTILYILDYPISYVNKMIPYDDKYSHIYNELYKYIKGLSPEKLYLENNIKIVTKFLSLIEENSILPGISIRTLDITIPKIILFKCFLDCLKRKYGENMGLVYAIRAFFRERDGILIYIILHVTLKKENFPNIIQEIFSYGTRYYYKFYVSMLTLIKLKGGYSPNDPAIIKLCDNTCAENSKINLLNLSAYSKYIDDELISLHLIQKIIRSDIISGMNGKQISNYLDEIGAKKIFSNVNNNSIDILSKQQNWKKTCTDELYPVINLEKMNNNNLSILSDILSNRLANLSMGYLYFALVDDSVTGKTNLKYIESISNLFKQPNIRIVNNNIINDIEFEILFDIGCKILTSPKYAIYVLLCESIIQFIMWYLYNLFIYSPNKIERLETIINKYPYSSVLEKFIPYIANVQPNKQNSILKTKYSKYF